MKEAEDLSARSVGSKRRASHNLTRTIKTECKRFDQVSSFVMGFYDPNNPYLHQQGAR